MPIARLWYKVLVATLADEPMPTPPTDAPSTSVGRRFLDCLAAQDFDGLAALCRDDVELRALLPGGLREWEGPEKVRAAFVRWFDGTKEYELTETSVGEVGPRLQLRWRARLQASWLDPGWFVVEQTAYADTDEEDRIRHLSVLCSGYLPEPDG